MTYEATSQRAKRQRQRFCFVADYEKKIGQLQTERDERVAKATMKLEMLSKLIEFENTDMGKAPPVAPACGFTTALPSCCSTA